MGEFDDFFLNERVPISVHLASVLGVATIYEQVKRYLLAGALGEHLGLNFDLMDAEAVRVLCVLAAQLDIALGEDPGHWTSDILQQRPLVMVQSATEDLALEEVVAALTQFGWSKVRLSTDRVQEIRPALVEALDSRLADRVRVMLDRWRSMGAWDIKVKIGLRSVPRPERRRRRTA